MSESTPLPEDPDLRLFARIIEEAGFAADILDHKWRIVYTSGENARVLGLDVASLDRHYGMSTIVRQEQHSAEWGLDRESGRRWFAEVLPLMLHDVPPDDPDFNEVFGGLAPRAREMEPKEPVAAHRSIIRMGDLEAYDSWDGPVQVAVLRLHNVAGRFVGTMLLSKPDVPQGLANRLLRGDTEMFRRMEALREPRRRPTAILFADLESSGELSRRLSSHAYFELIRSLTDLIDGTVAQRLGIIGKHAGDGASALFLSDDAGGESAAARCAIEAARTILDDAASLIDGIRVKVGVHWGATLVVGQVSTRGRLEVTALGDEMNEAARIEATAKGGSILASKNLLERLTPGDAQALNLDPDRVTYRTIAELGGSDKAVRDAGSIAVAEL